MSRFRFSAVLVLGALSQPFATPQNPPPLVGPLPGQVQPVAPGTRRAPSLPQLRLVPPIREVDKIEYLSNGFIEVASAIVLVGADARKDWRPLAAEVARRTFDARSSLEEVDVTIYDKASYGGFGGPLPIFTASVPRARLNDFLRFSIGERPYDRAWTAPPAAKTFKMTGAVEPTNAAVRGFLGERADLVKQQIDRAVAQFRGGEHGGMFFKGSSRVRAAALTFDDAPHPMYMPLVLDLLRRENVQATFFVIGRNAEAYPYFIHDMIEGGHEVGNHTYHHVRLPRLPDATVRSELQMTNDVVQRITGLPVRYFRPPGGEYSVKTLQIARQLGLTTTFWTDDPADFTNPGQTVLESRLVRRLRPGGLVLLHDNAPEGLAVLARFARVAETRGISLVTVGQLAEQDRAVR
ncbi:polysaccharide deacetylase family protein [Deinococcus yavapaiensis]|uniref:Peptidoglycan/xylan/chitin deacetylase (PgdA/CDA1 family) n=1 Tax=Deinococcus yavapaiensis KR-236 TaxID=694435 RepID=A0A318S7X6_9DEIO|nr:polysaccharide deacetylase family protein [Deinococcus yavapaiensis]PYE54552.1 peptidoglycan/xylan/chitin deacetylase (PgdA/CDA1 family) [Deinococcus yavapaiensis KR-236]